MKILLDLRVLTKESFGGVFEYAYFFVDTLLKNDDKNFYDLFYLGWRKKKLPENWYKENTNLLDIKVPNKIFYFLMKFFKWPKMDVFTDAKIIYSPHFNILEKGKYQKRILTIHDISFVHYFNFFSLKHKIWHWFQDINDQVKKADIIFTVSEFTKTDLINFLKLKEEKIKVLSPGLNPIYAYHKDWVKKDNIILYVGTIEPRKNLINLIKAFNLLKTKKEFKDFKLYLVGKKGWLFDDVFKVLKNSPYQEFIYYTGPLAYEEILKLYHQALVFVYPSYFEGFGLPPLEAQKCGLPVIVSDLEVFRENLKDSAFFVKPDSFYEIAFAIEEILSNNKLREKLIEKGFKNSSRFNWEDTIRNFLLWLKDFQ